MAASRFSTPHVLVGVGVLGLGLAACDNGRPARFALPTEPTAPSIAGAPAAPAPPPPASSPVAPFPIPFGPLVYTPLEIGTVVHGPVEDPPECLDELQWPCTYFQLTPRVSGRLEAVLTYSAATQGGQGVDLTLINVDDRADVWVWAQTFRPNLTGLEASVREGRTYHLVMRYAFDRLEFELTTSLKPE